MVKLDFANAFRPNSLHRFDMLLSVRYTACLSCMLFNCLILILFTTFISVLWITCPPVRQQGDPLGPLLFCTNIHPLITSLGSYLTLGYLDDLTLAGSQSVVATDIQQMMADGSKTGLCLNPRKCNKGHFPSSPATSLTKPIWRCNRCRGDSWFVV